MLLAMVVLLALSLKVLRDSRAHIESQDAKITALMHLSRPTLEQTDGLVNQAESTLDRTRPALRFVGRELPSVLRVLAPAFDRVPAIAVAGQQLIGEAIPAARAVSDSRLPETVTEASALIDRALASDLPARARRASRRLKELLGIQRQTLALQQQSVAIQRRSLDVQRRTLGHLRHLDNRTGGEIPLP